MIAALASGCGTTPVKPDRTVTHEIAPPGCVCPVWVEIAPRTVKPVKVEADPGWLLVPPEAGR